MSDLDEAPFKARGEAIKRRRLALGIAWRRELARAVGGKLDRDTVKRVEEGIASENSYERIEVWLDREEQRMRDEGVDPHDVAIVDEEDDFVEFRVTGNFGVSVVVKGPVRDLSQLEGAVGRLMDRARTTSIDSSDRP